MKELKITMFLMAVILITSCNTEDANTNKLTTSEHAIETRIGTLDFTHDFENGYPTDETVERLFNEMDFQRACQAYIWAIPYVSMSQWQHVHNEVLGAKNGQIIYFEDYYDKLGGLTYNNMTPYALPFIDLAVEGPFIAEMPDGEIRGAAHDFWQIGISQITEPGKYLFIGPGQKVEDTTGYKVLHSPTNNLLLGIRLMPTDSTERIRLLEKVIIYPYSERNNPKPRGYFRPEGKKWMAAQPRGMAYWERLADIINREPVHERDRFFLAMLKPLGIEKGKPFNPDGRQKKILEEAVIVGEAMAKANDFFNPRLESSHYFEGSYWEYATVSPPDQRWENYDALDGRAAWFYEAVTNDIAMHGQKTGWGQIYMASYKDTDGDWLDGGKNYVLHLPPNVPVELFWSITLYDVTSRCLIVNEQGIPDKSSEKDLLVNEDGSIDIYMGPSAPGGKVNNWIPTVEGKAWFPYFRLYSPKKEFNDKTWILPDIEKR